MWEHPQPHTSHSPDRASTPVEEEEEEEQEQEQEQEPRRRSMRKRRRCEITSYHKGIIIYGIAVRSLCEIGMAASHSKRW